MLLGAGRALFVGGLLATIEAGSRGSTPTAHSCGRESCRYAWSQHWVRHTWAVDGSAGDDRDGVQRGLLLKSPHVMASPWPVNIPLALADLFEEPLTRCCINRDARIARFSHGGILPILYRERP